MKFKTSEDMLNAIAYTDLYSPSAEKYVFSYNGLGSIAVYDISKAEAEELRQKKIEDECDWSAYLGFGGEIFDTEEYLKENGEIVDEYTCTPNVWCDEMLGIDDWEEV